MSDRLWSPQLRKWARDAELHGLDVGLYKFKAERGAEWGGGVVGHGERVTDGSDTRIADSLDANGALVVRITDT